MEDHSLFLNLTDEVDLAISAYIRDAKNVHELNGICGVDEEKAPNPYEVVARQLEYIKVKLIPEAMLYIHELRTHTHEWDEDGFCEFCGLDGNS